MKNLVSKTDPNRLKTLEARYERLIEANRSKHYVNSENFKRYFNVIQYLKSEMNKRMSENRKANENAGWRQALLSTKGMNGRQALITLTKEDLYNLTAPVL